MIEIYWNWLKIIEKNIMVKIIKYDWIRLNIIRKLLKIIENDGKLLLSMIENYWNRFSIMKYDRKLLNMIENY